MRRVDLHAVLADLGKTRPVFHSEADFQHSLAFAIHSVDPAASVRLEYRPFLEESLYVDVWHTSDGRSTGIELKHLTKAIDVTVNGERFLLRNHGAHDVSAYDVWKDVARLERVVAAGAADSGFLVVLTNDSLYWRPPARPGAGYDAFRLFDGRSVGPAALEWGAGAGPGTRKGREEPIRISGRYELAWSNYSLLSSDRHALYRSLVVEVRGPDCVKSGAADLST